MLTLAAAATAAAAAAEDSRCCCYCLQTLSLLPVHDFCAETGAGVDTATADNGGENNAVPSV